MSDITPIVINQDAGLEAAADIEYGDVIAVDADGKYAKTADSLVATAETPEWALLWDVAFTDADAGERLTGVKRRIMGVKVTVPAGDAASAGDQLYLGAGVLTTEETVDTDSRAKVPAVLLEDVAADTTGRRKVYVYL